MGIDNIVKKELCTGCALCVQICSRNCIHMREDEEGFRYPIIDSAKCIGCNVCRNMCPVASKMTRRETESAQVYAGWSKDMDNRIASTSGGIFLELAKQMIREEGYVVGASYTKDNSIEHILVEDKESLWKLRQSEYAQSNIEEIYESVEEKLKSGKKVLFCGTPCEVAAIYKKMKKWEKQLFLVDFICKGNNSPLAYKKYLNELEREYGKKITTVWFKNKDKGWNNFGTKIIFEDGTEYFKTRTEDIYMLGYLNHNMFIRKSCAECCFKGYNRFSDITLGDFWGIGKKDKNLDEDLGTSFIMVNSKSGAEMLNNIKNYIECTECDLNDAVGENELLFSSSTITTERMRFFKYIKRMKFSKSVKQAMKESAVLKMKRIIYKILFR